MTLSNVAIDPVEVRSQPARTMRDLTVILIAGLFIYGWKAGSSPISATEPLRALVGHQMVESGDWLVPRIYGELYLRKPPLQYWILAATEKAFGYGNEWVWRLPSVIGSALLAVFLAWWAGRWFGDRARLVSGFACLALIALWSQDRGADIDALNTTASILTACCILELGLGPGQGLGSPPRSGGWTFSLMLATGAMLLLKGPAGLPTVLGALLGMVIFTRDARPLHKRGIWLGLGAGVAIFAVWLGFITYRVYTQHLPMDSSGAQEAGERMLIRSRHDLAQALAVPLQVLIYSLPVSLALPLGLRTARQLREDSPYRNRILALAGTVLISLLIGIFAGIKNPRYSYIPMPLLAPLLGACAALAWDAATPDRHKLRCLLSIGLQVCCVLWVGVHLLLTAITFQLIPQIDPREHLTTPVVLLNCAAGVSVILGIIALRRCERTRATMLAAMIILAAIPFAEMKNAMRTQGSGRATGWELRAAVGDDPRIRTAAVVRDLPQVFYYANVPVETFGEKGLEQLMAAPGERWAVLNPSEYEIMVDENADRIKWVEIFRLARDTLFLVRFSGPAK